MLCIGFAFTKKKTFFCYLCSFFPTSYFINTPHHPIRNCLNITNATGRLMEKKPRKREKKYFIIFHQNTTSRDWVFGCCVVTPYFASRGTQKLRARKKTVHLVFKKTSQNVTVKCILLIISLVVWGRIV